MNKGNLLRVWGRSYILHSAFLEKTDASTKKLAYSNADWGLKLIEEGFPFL
jgi:hypothetical protein